MTSILGGLSFWFGHKLFRSPFVRRSERFHHWAMKIFRYSAERGNQNALAIYGSLLYFRGSDALSKEQGALYIKAAADLGDSKSEWQLAQFYESGVPPVIMQNSALALEYYERAAAKDHPLAIQRLVTLYSSGGLDQLPEPSKEAYWRSKQST